MLSFYAGLFVSLSQGLGLLYVFSLRFLSPVQYIWGEWNLKLVKKEHLYAETVSWSTKHIVELIPMKTTFKLPSQKNQKTYNVYAVLSFVR